MPKKFTQSKIAKLFAVWCEQQSDIKVSRICGVSVNTVKKYRLTKKWGAKYKKIKRKADLKVEEAIVDKRTGDMKLVENAIRAYAAALFGIARISCPHCKKPVDVPVPKLKAGYRDIDVILRLKQYLTAEGLGEEAAPKRIKYSIEPPSR